MPDVFFEEVDSVVDFHHENFCRPQICQLPTCLVNGCQFLLLKNLIRHVTDGHNQLTRVIALDDWSGMDLIVPIALAMKRACALFAGRQCSVKRAEVRSHDFRIRE